MSPGWSAPTVVAVRNVPRWGLLSSGAAPVLMVGGWMAATSLQPRSVDPMAETVSALASVDAAERWVMTATFLRWASAAPPPGSPCGPAGAAGRLILMAGAGVGMLVAAFPQPADGGSLLHAIWASAGFGALTVWPAAAWRRAPGCRGRSGGRVCHRRRDACLARPPRSRPFPGTDPASARPRRPDQRVRADRIEPQVSASGRVMDPTGSPPSAS